jgi:lipoprotein-releasing system ATP-binding protein
MSQAVIKLSNLNKSFISGDETLNILNDINLEIEPGSSMAITGPSGCGKSTLLNLLGTLDTADSGSIEIDGKNIQGLSEQELANIRLTKLGFVFQKHHLLPQLTALENVLLPTLKDQTKECQNRAVELLDRVGLKDRMLHRPGQLSGGECQRVALCRALINKPTVLLADEPTGALDSSSSNNLIDLLLKLNKEDNLTLVTVTHSQHVADQMALKYILSNGTLEKR